MISRMAAAMMLSMEEVLRVSARPLLDPLDLSLMGVGSGPHPLIRKPRDGGKTELPLFSSRMSQPDR